MSQPSKVPLPASVGPMNNRPEDRRILFLQQISEPIRHNILSLLAKEKELSVTDILAKLQKPQTLVSYHLRCLKDIGLLTMKKDSIDQRKLLYSLHNAKDLEILFSSVDNYISKHGNCGSNPCSEN